LSFVAPLFDMLSDGEGDVVADDEDDGAEVLGDMLLELLDVLPDGDEVVADEELDVSLDGLVVDGAVVEGLIVLLVVGDVVDELELVDGVVEGVVVVDEVLLVSR
jgi:hypothetical protein